MENSLSLGAHFLPSEQLVWLYFHHSAFLLMKPSAPIHFFSHACGCIRWLQIISQGETCRPKSHRPTASWLTHITSDHTTSTECITLGGGVTLQDVKLSCTSGAYAWLTVQPLDNQFSWHRPNSTAAAATHSVFTRSHKCYFFHIEPSVWRGLSVDEPWGGAGISCSTASYRYCTC